LNCYKCSEAEYTYIKHLLKLGNAARNCIV
jgi:hypothetical protein